MKLFGFMMLLATALLFVPASAPASRPAAPAVSLPYPAVIMEILDPSLAQYSAGWQAEIGRRFPHAVGVLCHGGEFVGGQWIVSAKSYGRLLTAPDIARYEQAKYPDRTIVLLCCNPGHLHLGVAGVYFATDSVWCVPDRGVLDDPDNADATLHTDGDTAGAATGRWSKDPSVVGNIFEMIEE